eukprot:GHRR01034523.1.p1 GENE.GHRR01034523.1~~GHRR01034523.1.p1  ORF type:complete len:154 (+),score=38.11 GHRR01034523.1:334-795(+)
MQEPTVPGVKTTMEFPDLSIGQYITQQYSQNVANALASVTNVPSTSVTAIDVRPFLGSSSSSGRRRLAQAAGNGVQVRHAPKVLVPAVDCSYSNLFGYLSAGRGLANQWQMQTHADAICVGIHHSSICTCTPTSCASQIAYPAALKYRLEAQR